MNNANDDKSKQTGVNCHICGRRVRQNDPEQRWFEIEGASRPVCGSEACRIRAGYLRYLGNSAAEDGF